MMEDEQNLKKNTCKGTHAKCPKNAGKLQTQARKCMKKIQDLLVYG